MNRTNDYPKEINEDLPNFSLSKPQTENETDQKER